MMALNFDETPEFRNDVKRLKKSWRSISSDVERAKRAITPLYAPIKGVDTKELREQFFATPRATRLKATDEYEVVKMRLDCASLGSDKKTRIVFVVIKAANTIHLVELFAKNEKNREDPSRYRRFIK